MTVFHQSAIYKDIVATNIGDDALAPSLLAVTL
jgi:hypothetical protein